MSLRYPGGFVTASYNGLKVPNAPTIGTATAGGASASVTFTAPVDVGGGAITGYIVRSNPGNVTGTGASSPVTVSGLSNGTAYTFRVFATNAFGTGPASAASNSVTPVMQIGDAYAGGYYAGQIGVSGTATHNLVIAPLSTGQTRAKWENPVGTLVPGASSEIDGPQNTADIVANGNATSYPAAHFCNNLVTGGYSDWYMAAKNELEVCYYNLKPTTDLNNTASGINANAVPARASNYTTGTPAQTSATAFRSGGTEPFLAQSYWSSTQTIPAKAWLQAFANGNQRADGKYQNYYIRAVRRVAV